ncbi:hypothetical protein E2320_011010, partial [Naja naja]
YIMQGAFIHLNIWSVEEDAVHPEQIGFQCFPTADRSANEQLTVKQVNQYKGSRSCFSKQRKLKTEIIHAS